MKGGHATLAQLAEKWLSRSRKIIEHAFSSDDYTIQLEEAEQFLWAGSEMDPVSIGFYLFTICFSASEVGSF